MSSAPSMLAVPVCASAFRSSDIRLRVRRPRDINTAPRPSRRGKPPSPDPCQRDRPGPLWLISSRTSLRGRRRPILLARARSTTFTRARRDDGAFRDRTGAAWLLACSLQRPGPMARPEAIPDVAPPYRAPPAPKLRFAAKRPTLREPAKGAASAADLAPLASVAAAVVFVLSVVRLGWVSDDAFITIRSVEHLLAGDGFGPNPGVRVQAFTSPRRALLCVPLRWLTGDPYGALVLGGLVCTLGLSVLVCWWLRPLPWRAALGLLALSASTSFVEFSTSGLENSLTHLLIAAFCLERLERPNRPTTAMFALAGALFLTRFDLARVVVPALAISSLSAPRGALRRALVPLVPVAAWLAFATLYYGFPQPNTALAKLNVELPLLAKV